MLQQGMGVARVEFTSSSNVLGLSDVTTEGGRLHE
jgi:hypothetical protein